MGWRKNLSLYVDEWKWGLGIAFGCALAVILGPLVMFLLLAIPYGIAEMLFTIDDQTVTNWIMIAGLIVFTPYYLSVMMKQFGNSTNKPD